MSIFTSQKSLEIFDKNSADKIWSKKDKGQYWETSADVLNFFQQLLIFASFFSAAKIQIVFTLDGLWQCTVVIPGFFDTVGL